MPEAPAQNQPTQEQIRQQAILTRLWNDKEYGPHVRKVSKELYPDISIPEDYALPYVEKMEARLKEQNDKLEAMAAELKKEREARDSEKQTINMKDSLDRAAAKYSLTSEGIDRMVERMKETGNVTDAEAAAAWVAQANPPPKTPTRTYLGPERLDLFKPKSKEDPYVLLRKDPDRFLDEELRKLGADPEGYASQAA